MLIMLIMLYMGHLVGYSDVILDIASQTAIGVGVNESVFATTGTFFTGLVNSCGC